jgi:hypothetical protein
MWEVTVTTQYQQNLVRPRNDNKEKLQTPRNVNNKLLRPRNVNKLLTARNDNKEVTVTT